MVIKLGYAPRDETAVRRNRWKTLGKISLMTAGIGLTVGACSNTLTISEAALGRNRAEDLSAYVPLFRMWPERILSSRGLRGEAIWGDTSHDFFLFYTGGYSDRLYLGHFKNELKRGNGEVKKRVVDHQEGFFF